MKSRCKLCICSSFSRGAEVVFLTTSSCTVVVVVVVVFTLKTVLTYIQYPDLSYP